MSSRYAFVLIALLSLRSAAVAQQHQTFDVRKATSPHEPVAMVGKSLPPSAQYDVPPKLLSGRTPIYPITQLREHRSGDALIAFTIDEQGIPRDFRILKTDYSYFATHAIAAMREWRFQPATKNGRPVAARIRIPIHYGYLGPKPAPAQF